MVLPISPMLIIAAFQAAYKLAQVAETAASQHLRDDPHVIPGARFTVVDFGPHSASDVQSVYDEGNGRFRSIVVELELQETYEDIENNSLALAVLSEQLVIYLKAIEDAATEDLAAFERFRRARVRQWDEGDEPVSPWMRLGIAFADIAAGFVAANPKLLGDNENVQALVGAFARNLSELIPDDDSEYGLQYSVGTRLFGIAFRAGLGALSENTELIFEKKKVAELVNAAIDPVLLELPDGLQSTEVTEWKRVREAVLGPSVAAAVRVVASDPEALLGDRFDTDGIVGGMTKGLLDHMSSELATNSLREVILDDQALLGLFRSAINVVAKRPELVVEGGTARQDFFKTLLGNVATTLGDPEMVFDKRTAVRLAQVSLESFGDHAPGLIGLNEDNPWEAVAAMAMGQILAGFKDGLSEQGAAESFRRIFTQDQIVELGRLVAAQAAKTPGMLVGDSTSPEVRRIVGAVSKAIAEDAGLLLDGKDWLEIVTVVLEEAGRNPGRLFGIDTDNPAGELGVVVTGVILKEAAAAARTGRSNGNVLFGETLKTALVAALRQAASNPALAAKAFGFGDDPTASKVAELLRDTLEAVNLKTDGSFNLGAKEWLRIFRGLLPDLISGVALPKLVENGTLTEQGRARIETILSNHIRLAGV